MKRLFLLTALMLVMSSLYAQVDRARAQFVLSTGAVKVDPRVGDNAKQLQVLDSIMSEFAKVDYADRYLVIRSYASPEGAEAANKSLAVSRGQSLQNYIVNKYGVYGMHTIFDPIVYEWANVLNAVRDDAKVPSREKVIAVLENVISNKMARQKVLNSEVVTLLRNIDKGNAYHYIRNNVFSKMRSVSVETRYINLDKNNVRVAPFEAGKEEAAPTKEETVPELPKLEEPEVFVPETNIIKEPEETEDVLLKKQEEERLKAEAEAKAKAEAEAEAARIKAEEEAKAQAEAEAKAKAEAEAARLKAEQEAKAKAEAEAARLKAEEEAKVKAEAARLKAEEEARAKAEAEAARLKAEQEAKAKAEAAVAAAVLAEKVALEEARLKAEAEARAKAAEEARLKAEAEARAKAAEEARLKSEEEAKAKAKAEAEARQKAAEEARLKAEEEARLKALEEARDSVTDVIAEEVDSIVQDTIVVPETVADTTIWKPFEQRDSVQNFPELQRSNSGFPFYRFALKTNLLYDIALIPNISLEYAITDHWSVAADWEYAWWSKDFSHKFWRTYGGNLEVRYYLNNKDGRLLTGHHFGAYGGILTYDVEWGGKGYMGEKWSKMFGLSYGYAAPIGRRLHLDFELGIGYFGGEYYEYSPQGDKYFWEQTKNRRWFGPTRAEATLVWMLGKDAKKD